VAIHSNYNPVLYCFQDKVRFWLKILIFRTALAFGLCLVSQNPVKGEPLAFYGNILYAKTRMLGQLEGEKV